MSLTVPIVEWLERHAGKQGVAGSTSGRDIYFHFEYSLTSLAHITTKAIQIKSSLVFIQSNGRIEIY